MYLVHYTRTVKLPGTRDPLVRNYAETIEASNAQEAAEFMRRRHPGDKILVYNVARVKGARP